MTKKCTTEAQRHREKHIVAISALSASLRLRGEIVFPSVFSAASVPHPKEDEPPPTFNFTLLKLFLCVSVSLW
jgi:hypothetical protein